jgi:transcriptional regulator GlxA family with amidase domain
MAAGRFVALCYLYDAALAARARRHPLEAARIAAGRGEPIARIAAETGFVEGSARFASYREAFGEPADPGDASGS